MLLSNRVKFLLDGLAFCLSVYLSLWLRLDFSATIVVGQYSKVLIWGTVIDAIAGIVFILVYKTYRQIWRYTSLKELWDIARIVFWEKVIFILIIQLLFWNLFPRSVFLLSPLISFGLMVLPRFLARFYYDGRFRYFRKGGKKALIVGAGDAGEKISREIAGHPELGFNIVGFVDDDAKKVSSFLHGYRVLGKIKDIPELVKKQNVETIIVAIPSAGRQTIKKIYDFVSSFPVETLVMPGMYELIGKKISITSLRSFNLEDLLFRDPVFYDVQRVGHFFRNKKVLVTGACGSIGSEICRQLALSGSHLILLDNNETGIFDLSNELGGNAEISPVVADIRFPRRLEAIIQRYCPKVIFHAAAYKHVPLMEENGEEAFHTNVVGTLNLLETAQGRAKKVVVISTDKAVEPENMMGLSKKMTEVMVLAAAKSFSDTDFSVVRFGNVLGSRGNVLEVWKKQIEKKEPLTITDPAMKRYFMTTQEAVTLVLEASMLPDSGNIFVLKMGEMIPILELARVFCEIQGYVLEKDIDVEITGIRPGEKIIEKLWEDQEPVVETAH
ncbi:MAG: nucleoside-diphosphate sugar epimerase/dehydratase, partial [Atribacterota bacterium]